jgi:hypothetical protein
MSNILLPEPSDKRRHPYLLTQFTTGTETRSKRKAGQTGSSPCNPLDRPFARGRPIRQRFESVFSGMARAIVDNSGYGSLIAAKDAIAGNLVRSPVSPQAPFLPMFLGRVNYLNPVIDFARPHE